MEIWNDIKGYEGFYKISSYGRIKSLDRTIIRKDGIKQFKKGVIKQPKINSDGYHVITLSKNGFNKTIGIHRLVALNFIPCEDETMEVNHKDYNRCNNQVSNLEWVTHKENVAHSAKIGKYSHYGRYNSNYKGKKLKQFYNDNPEEKQKLARCGTSNGMCKPIAIILPNKDVKEFDYIGECADFMIKSNLVSGKNVNGIRDRITKSIKNNTPYCNCKFKLL